MNENLTAQPQVNIMLDLFNKEEQPFKRVHRMIDLFETIIKTHTAFIMSSYFMFKDIPEHIKGLLAEGLTIPALGVWIIFCREIMNDLAVPRELNIEQFKEIIRLLKREQITKFESFYIRKGDSYYIREGILPDDIKFLIHKCFSLNNFIFSPRFIINNFYHNFYEWNNSVDKAVDLRNKYAHGATPEDSECLKDIDDFQAVLEGMLKSSLLHDLSPVAFNRVNDTFQLISGEIFCRDFVTGKLVDSILSNNTGIRDYRIYMTNREGSIVCLFPVMTLHKIRKDNSLSITFYNDLKKLNKKTITYLNYPYAQRIPDNEIYNEFMSIINVQEWRGRFSSQFKERIEDLTEIFKGRGYERERIKAFISNSNKGFMMVYGKPGIGKSALSAQIIKELKAESKINENKKDKKLCCIEYFIQKGSESSTILNFLDYMNTRLENIYQTKIPLGDTAYEKRVNLMNRLMAVSQNLTGKKLVLFIDGLDEGNGESFDILDYLFNKCLINIIVIYSSRPVDRVTRFFDSLPLEYKESMEIGRLDECDIRAMLYDVVNKYEIQKEHVDIISDKSEGNPLYLKMLCLSLEKGETKLDNLNVLCKGLEMFYQSILRRLSDQSSGGLLLKGLFVIAAAREYICKKQLELILNIDEADSERLIEGLQEILIENSTRPGSYQLFHDSYREFLKNNRYDNIREAEEKIVAYCRRWKELDIYSDNMSKYPLKHYHIHLENLNRDEELYSLAADEDYIKAQVSGTGDFAYSFDMYRSIFNLTAGDYRRTINLAIKAAKLHIRLKSNVGAIIRLVREGSRESLQKALENIKFFEEDGQMKLYSIILFEIFFNMILEDETRRELVEIIIGFIKNNPPNGSGRINWHHSVPLSFMIKILIRIRKLGIDVKSLVNQRDSILGVLDDGIYYILEGIDLKDQDCYEVVKEITPRILGMASKLCFELCSLGLFDETVEISNSIKVWQYNVRGAEMLVDIAAELRAAKKDKQAKYVLERALAELENAPDILNKSDALSYISIEFCMQGFIENALNIAQGIKSVDSRDFAYREITIELCKQGLIEKAMDIIHRIESNEEKDAAYCDMAVDFCRQGMVDRAVGLAKEIRSYEDRVTALCGIVLEISEHGFDSQAPRIIRQIIEPEVEDKVEFSTIQSILGVVKIIKINKLMADNLIGKAEKMAASLDEFEELVRASLEFNLVGRDTTSVRLKEKAVEIAREAPLIGELIDVVNDLCEEYGDSLIEFIEIVVDRIQQEGNKPINPYRFVKLFRVLKKTQSKNAGLMERAIGIAWNNREKTGMMEILCHELGMTKVKEILIGTIEESKLVKVDDRWNQIFKCTMIESVKRDLTDRALEIIKCVKGKKRFSRMLDEITPILLQKGDIEKVEEIACMDKKYDANSLTYTRLGMHLLKGGNEERGFKILEECGGDNIIQHYKLEQSVKAFARKGLADDALIKSQEFKNTYSRSMALMDIAKEMLTNGRKEDGILFIDRAIENANEETIESERQRTLMSIGSKLNRMGLLDITTKLLEMINLDDFRFPILIDLIEIFMEKDRTADANDLIGRVIAFVDIKSSKSHSLTRYDILGEIAAIWATRGEFTKVLELLKSRPQHQVVDIFRGIINSIEHLDIDIALKLIDQSIMNDEDRCVIYIELLSNMHIYNGRVPELFNRVLPHIYHSIAHLSKALLVNGYYLRFISDLDYEERGLILEEIGKIIKIPDFLTNGGDAEYSIDNMSQWIEKIYDEDDREDISYWSEKVRKGIMTREKFELRVNEILKKQSAYVKGKLVIKGSDNRC